MSTLASSGAGMPSGPATAPAPATHRNRNPPMLEDRLRWRLRLHLQHRGAAKAPRTRRRSLDHRRYSRRRAQLRQLERPVDGLACCHVYLERPAAAGRLDRHHPAPPPPAPPPPHPRNQLPCQQQPLSPRSGSPKPHGLGAPRYQRPWVWAPRRAGSPKPPARGAQGLPAQVGRRGRAAS